MQCCRTSSHKNKTEAARYLYSLSEATGCSPPTVPGGTTVNDTLYGRLLHTRNYRASPACPPAM